jgi:hypothetical protein
MNARWLNATPPSIRTIGLIAVLSIVLLIQLSLLGVTDYPFRASANRDSDTLFQRVLTGAEHQCRFGNALVSAGGPSRVDDRKRIRPRDFAQTYAQSFSGISPRERERLEKACLQGFGLSPRR